MATSKPPQAPIKFRTTPEAIQDETREIIQRTSDVWDSIVTLVDIDRASFENTILPIAHDENVSLERNRLIKFFASSSPFKEVRDASHAATVKFNEAELALYSRSDMFRLVDAVRTKYKSSSSQISAESLYYIDKLHRGFIQNGCGIEDETAREQFGQSKKRLIEVNKQAIRNFHEDNTGLWLTREELDGLPEDLISQLKNGTDEHEGKLWLSTKTSHSNPALINAKSEETRKKVLYAVKNRLPGNISLHREVVLLRDEIARLLGYPHHLAFRAADKTVQTPETVTNFLSDIRQKLGPGVRHNTEELLALKVAEKESRGESVDDVQLYFWDQSYYARLQTEASGRSAANISEYFELHHTLQTMLDIFSKLFDTRFERIEAKQQSRMDIEYDTWHEDVLMYAVWDTRSSNAFLGYAYIDLYPREGKYSHAGCYVIQKPYLPEAGEEFYTSAALMLNYSKPTRDKPSLLTMQTVRQLFHELGHLHHDFCTKARYARLAAVDRDFVEAPSLMFEEFLWVEEAIKSISHHYAYISDDFKQSWLAKQASEDVGLPPPKLSDEDAAALSKIDIRTHIRQTASNLHFALYDVFVHSPSSHEALASMNLVEEFIKSQVIIRELQGGESCGDGWDWGHGEACFRAIAGTYDAGYYAYLLGRVWARDMFTTYFKDGLRSDGGKRFRDMILEKGGSQPELQTLREYLGREPDSQPFFEWLGIR